MPLDAWPRGNSLPFLAVIVALRSGVSVALSTVLITRSVMSTVIHSLVNVLARAGLGRTGTPTLLRSVPRACCFSLAHRRRVMRICNWGFLACCLVLAVCGCNSGRQSPEPAAKGLRAEDLVGKWWLVRAGGKPPAEMFINSMELDFAADGTWKNKIVWQGPLAGMTHVWRRHLVLDRRYCQLHQRGR